VKPTKGTNVKTKKPNLRLAVLGAAVLLSLMGCTQHSSSDANDDEANGNTVNPSDVLTPDKASGEPIKLGFLDPSRGPTAQPGSASGAAAAEKYINEYHGGISGRPIDLDLCAVDATPESIVNCANKFVQDGVVAVTESVTFNDGAALPILDAAKIPLIGYGAASFESVFSQTSYFFGPAVPSYTVAPFQYFLDNDQSSVAFIFGDNPNNRDYVKAQFDPIAQALGVDFQAVYYDDVNVNWTTVAASLIATKAPVVGVAQLAEGACTDLIKALVQQGFSGSIFVGGCTKFADEVDLPESVKVFTASGLWLPQARSSAPADAQQQLDVFSAAMGEAGQNEYLDNTYAVQSFSTLVTLADILTSADADLTAPGIDAAVKATKNAPSFLGGPISCDYSVWPGQSACTSAIITMQAQADGTFEPATDPAFTTVDPSVLGG
jgi:branched-chain amino acid transport system substrate-binding protein